MALGGGGPNSIIVVKSDPFANLNPKPYALSPKTPKTPSPQTPT